MHANRAADVILLHLALKAKLPHFLDHLRIKGIEFLFIIAIACADAVIVDILILEKSLGIVNKSADEVFFLLRTMPAACSSPS